MRGLTYLSAEKKEIERYIKSYDSDYHFSNTDFDMLAEMINETYHGGLPMRTRASVQWQLYSLRRELRRRQPLGTLPSVILPHPPATQDAVAVAHLSRRNAAAARSLLKVIQPQLAALRREMRRHQPPAASPDVIIPDPPTIEVAVAAVSLFQSTATAVQSLLRSFIKKVQKFLRGIQKPLGGIQKPLGDIQKPLGDIDRR